MHRYKRGAAGATNKQERDFHDGYAIKRPQTGVG
jgi:hypothetical protein